MTNYTISHNDAYNSIEITFDTMPSARIRCGLKERGFRWHSMKRLWYGKCNEAELRTMIENEHEFTSEQPEAGVPVPTEIPAPATAVFNQNTAMELVAELDALRTMLTADSDDNRRALIKLDEIRKLAREELARTSAKKRGMAQTRNVAKRMLKAVKKINPNSAFCYPAYLDSQQIICDTHKLISLNTPIDGLGERPDDCDPIKSTTLATLTRMPEDLEPLTLPALTDLKLMIKAQTAGHKADHGTTKKMPTITYDFGASLPLVDASYLVDMLEALPDCTAYMSPAAKNYAVYFKSEIGTGILMPLRRR